MPDWEAHVSERLGALEVPEAQRAAIVRELAGHLEDFYLEKCAQGWPASAAWEQALAHVADWTKLTQKIRMAKREEGSMNYRTKSYWLPGLVTFTASMVLLMILQLTIPIRHPWYPTDYMVAAHRGSFPRMASNTGAQIYFLAAPYLFWLLAQPALGALGAYLSRRGGGEKHARLVAGVFPSLLFLGALSIVFVIAVFVERNAFVLAHPAGFAMLAVPVVVIPGVALVLGVLPFLRESKKEAS
jgi:hypothetical protein